MSHWFDRLCLSTSKERAGEVPRRNFLVGALSGAALAFVEPSSSLRAQSAGKPAAGRAPRALRIVPGACYRRVSSGVMTQSVKLGNQGVTYQRSIAYDTTAKSVTDVISISRNGQAFLDATVTVLAGGSSTASVNYGPLVSGARAVRVTSPDGKAFRGTVDGRSVVSSVDKKFIPTTEFLDHRPAPVLKASPDLKAPINLLAKQIRSRLSGCLPAPTNPILHGPISIGHLRVGALDATDPGLGWYEPGGTYNAPECSSCWNDCNDFAASHSGLEDWETYLSALAFVAALASYDIILAACWGACQLPGGGCDPVPCGGPFISCGHGDNCFRGDLCCPGNMSVCNNVCCGPNISGCNPDGGCACPGGVAFCGEQCCKPGQVCCGGQCSDGCNGGCPPPQNPCGGNCCAPFTTCCNNQCCASACVNNTCCPAEQVCGNSCCAPGQVCSNGSCFGCTPLQVRLGYASCQSNTFNGTRVGACCPRISPTCCGGACCAPGQNFCFPSNGTLICSSNSPIH